MNDIKLFREYIKTRNSGKKTVEALARENKMTRSQLYARLSKISVGRVRCMNSCIATSRLACIWEYKYKARYEMLPDNREGSTVDELRALIVEMYQEGFSQVRIAAYINRDRTTVLHHLHQWKLSQ